MDLLDTPLRGTWSLCGTDPLLTTEEALGMARRLADAGLFFLTLEQQPLAHPGFERILAELGGGGVQTSVVYSSTAEERRSLDPALPLARLWLDAAPFIGDGVVDENALEEELELLRDKGYDPQLLLVPLRENIQLLPEFLEVCQRLRVGSFKLPNVPIDGNFSSSDSSLIRPADLARLAEKGPDRKVAETDVKMDIHDRFIWEIFSGPKAVQHSEYGGCQAANSLVHLDCRGEVWPCSSWPQRLGSLLEKELEEIWNGRQRMDVRREIAAEPVGCRSCRDYALCLGACRGLGRSLNGTDGERDPACSGPR